MSIRIVSLLASPRRRGNTALLLDAAAEGARSAGAEVASIVLRDLKISPCLEIYGCAKTGQCAIRDDFQKTVETVLAADGVIFGSPIFFYTVSALAKAFMDRCQSLWVKKYWIEKRPPAPCPRKGLFVSCGATQGKKIV